MKQIVIAAVLVLSTILITGCRGKKEHQLSRYFSNTQVASPGDSSDLAGLPEQFRYPGAEVRCAGQNEEPHLNSGHYLLATRDGLATVKAFYQQALVTMGADFGGSYSDEMVTFDATSEDANQGILCALVPQDTGTLIIIINWAKH